uniref:(northern house mosquito) hypothetical protein n=1 Tax=Culex pipiens TaxID=7175 RepID=A0A8D8A900_CULPI
MWSVMRSTEVNRRIVWTTTTLWGSIPLTTIGMRPFQRFKFKRSFRSKSSNPQLDCFRNRISMTLASHSSNSCFLKTNLLWSSQFLQFLQKNHLPSKNSQYHQNQQCLRSSSNRKTIEPVSSAGRSFQREPS